MVRRCVTHTHSNNKNFLNFLKVVSTVVSTHDFEETTEATTQHRTEAPSSSVRVKITETPLRTTTTAHQEKTTSQYGPINIALGENLYTNQYPPFIS